MQELQPQVIDPESVGIPEFPLGAALDRGQLRELSGFAVDAFRSYWAGVDTREEFAKQLDSYGEGYTPELAFNILKAIGSVGVLKGVDNDPRQLEHVAQDEAGFQAVLAGSVLNGYNAALNMPRAYRAVAGVAGFEAALEDVVEQNPGLILSNIGNLSKVLESEELDEKVKSAYEAIQRDESQRLSPYQLSEDLARVVGQERLVEDVHRAIDTGDFFGTRISLSTVQDVAELRLITADEALTIALDALRKGEAFLDLSSLEKIALLGENTHQLWEKVQETALAIIDDPESDEGLVSDIAQSFARTISASYDKEFSTRIIDEIKDKRGPIALLPLVSYYRNDESREEFVDEIVTGALQVFRGERDDKKRGAIAKALISVIDKFDPDTKRELISCYAENDPSDFVYSIQLKPSEKKSDEDNKFLRETVLVAIRGLQPEQAISRIDTLKGWFDRDDPRLKNAILSRCEDLESFSSIGSVEAMTELLSRDELQTIFAKVLNKSEQPWELQATFSTAVKVFGFEDAKNIFADQIRTKPALALGLLTNNQMMLEKGELSELIQVVVKSDKLSSLMYQLNHLAYRLPKAELVELLDAAVVKAPGALLEQLKSLSKVIDGPTTSRLIYAVMQQNPALVLSSLKQLPKGFISGTDEVVEFMKGDERSKLAPKYFQKIMKRLPKAEDTTAFLILSKEAERVYMKLNKILSVEENRGVEMLLRIQESMGSSSERAELDSISLTALMAVEGVDPETVQTINDAKKNAVVAINKRLGSALNPEEFDTLEAKLGSLVPLSMYSLSITDTNKPYQENGEYLREIVSQVASGSYQAWRYGDRTELIDEGIIPELTQDQYATWQETLSVESSDIVADDASSVARRIQEVISRGLLENHTIEKLSNLENPEATLGEIKAELGDIGKRIGEVHKMKKAGELSEEEAETQVTELQDQKQQLELAANIIRLSKITPDEVAAGVLFNEKGRPTKATIDGTLNEIVERYGVEAMEAFGQLDTVLENYRDAATTDIGSVTVGDVDDFQTTFEIGANTVGSCQHYELGQFNVGLPGYFEPSVKIISVKNEKDKLVARAVVRLASDENNQPVMVLEPVYMSQASNDIEGAIKAHAKTKANHMGIRLFSEGRGGRKNIQLRNQRAPRIYSDIFGGIREKGAEQPAIARNDLVLVD